MAKLSFLVRMMNFPNSFHDLNSVLRPREEQQCPSFGQVVKVTHRRWQV